MRAGIELHSCALRCVSPCFPSLHCCTRDHVRVAHLRDHGTSPFRTSGMVRQSLAFREGTGCPTCHESGAHLRSGTPVKALDSWANAPVDDESERTVESEGTLRALGVPASWNFYVVSLAAMLALAGLDFVGALFAKEWAERHHPGFFLAGLLCFGVLFAVYAASLQVAELSVVTFGWIVFLQVGLLILDRVRYGVELPPGKWVAIAVILVLQAYLILAPNGAVVESEANSSAAVTHEGRDQ